VLGSLPRDAAHRQLFVPLQLLEQHGSGMEELFAGQPTPSIRAAFADLVREAGQHLETALQLLMDVPRQIRPLFLPLALVRRDIARLSRVDSDPFRPQPRSHLATLWTLWRASRTRTFRAG
jgi:15-cis-phytoene synthase